MDTNSSNSEVQGRSLRVGRKKMDGIEDVNLRTLITS